MNKYVYMCVCVCVFMSFPGGSVVKNPPAKAGDVDSMMGQIS